MSEGRAFPDAALAAAGLGESAGHHLFVSGALHLAAETLFLLSPCEPGFWAHVSAQPEFIDKAPDPLDRWSHRVISALAAGAGGRAFFPFGGPPHSPFFGWMQQSGWFFASPVHLLVHPHMGLWASVRGAIALPGLHPLPPVPLHPCTDCPAPCTDACPAGALTRARYDVPACHAYLHQRPAVAAKAQFAQENMEKDCLTAGCITRRTCPISLGYGRLDEQSAWHMRHFHR